MLLNLGVRDPSTLQFKGNCDLPSLISFSFNGQEKTDEIAGIGSHNTALFWEYDTRSGRRWNLDPKPTVGISDYSALANNPIWFIDYWGDKWGKPNDDPNKNKDKKQADKLKAEFSQRKDDYESKFKGLSDKLNNFTGTDTEKNELETQKTEAEFGMKDMAAAMDEIDIIGSDKNYYTFNGTGEKLNRMSAVDNRDGSFTININYNMFDSGNKVHEARHAADVAKGVTAPVFSSGSSTTKLFTGVSELNAYTRQYFYDKTSMPIKVKNFRDLMPIRNYLEKINQINGQVIY